MKTLIYIDACMRAGSRTRRSAMKVFFENMSLFGITFDSNDKECFGLCKAEKVMYITTRGMNIMTGDPL